MATTVLNGRTVPKYIKLLPNLFAPGNFIDATAGQYSTTPLPLYMRQSDSYDFGLGLGAISSVWGYSPSQTASGYLGPTILAQKNVPVNVNWTSILPQQHLLPVDTTVHWAYTGTNYTISNDGVPVAVHRHGGYQVSDYDGLPDAWFTSTGTIKGRLALNNGSATPYNPQPYNYTNDQEAATLWYHDHALGITRLNVYAGLAGFYILRDQYDTGTPNNPLNLPANYGLDTPTTTDDHYYEYPLVFQDKLFYGPGTTDNPSTPWIEAPGQLFYPSSNADLALVGLKPALPPGVPNPSVIPEFAAGNVILVNGKAWPVLDVEPRQYRFRLLNGSDSRFYTFTLPGNVPFTQIGTDDGLLNAPVKLNSLNLAPGQRADVVIDFARQQGKTLVLNNKYGGNGARPVPNDPQTTGQIMAFRVGNTVTVPDVPLPPTLRGRAGQPDSITLPTTVSPLDGNDVTTGATDPLTGLAVAKQVGLFESPLSPLGLPNRFDAYGRTTPLLGTVKDGALKWEDPVTEKVQLNQTEIWEIYNTTKDPHPIHLHEIPFQLVDRQKFSATQATPTSPLTNIKFQGGPTPAAANEAGLLDTVVVSPGEVVRIAATFGLPGEYVWHCHILSHEDNEMMRPYQVIPPV